MRKNDMEIEDLNQVELDSDDVLDGDLTIDLSKRAFLRAAGLMVAGALLPQARADWNPDVQVGSQQKVVLVVVGGVRRA